MTPLCGQLKDVINDYFNRYPNTSINSLAAKSGVGATTLRRILGDGLKGDPAPHTVLSIASSVTKEKRLSVLVTMFDGPLGELLKETFSPYVDMEMDHVLTEDLNSELRDVTKYMIYKCAANRVGVRASWVVDTYGKSGLEKLKEMVSRGFLKGGPEVFHATEKNFSLDIEVAAGHLPEAVRFYRPEDVAKGDNLFYTVSESINDEAIAKIKKIQLEATRKIFEIMSDESSAGDKHYMTIALMDILNKSENSGDDEVIQ